MSALPPPPPPHNLEAEQALLGAVLLNNDAFHMVSGIVKVEQFYSPQHGQIWQIIKDQIESGKAANPVTIKSYLDGLRVGDFSGYEYTIRLVTEAVTVINAKDYATVVSEMATRRKLLEVGDKIKVMALSSSPESPVKNLLTEIEADIDNLQDDLPDNDSPGSAKTAVEKLMALYQSKEAPATIEAPLPEIREVLNGDFEAKNLYGLLSASGEGKTSLALQIIDHAASNGHPVFFLSYDQTETQCMMQIACQRLGLDGKRIRDRTLTEQEAERYFIELMKIRKLPIQIKSCGKENINRIESYVRRFMKWNRSGKTALIALDHVRKVSPIVAGTYEGRVASEIGGASKALAKEYDLVWLNIMQRKSMKEGRENPQPYDGDLFGGEQAKEDYDGILYLYRPDKYKDMRLSRAHSEKKRDQLVAYHERWSGLSKLGSLKIRFGDPSIYKALRFEGTYTRYSSTRQESEDFGGLF